MHNKTKTNTEPPQTMEGNVSLATHILVRVLDFRLVNC